MREFKFLTGVDQHPYRGANPARAVNMYVQVNESWKTGMIWSNFPGWKVYASLAAGVNRGACLHKGNLYTVVERDLYRVTPGGGWSVVGSINTTEGHVSMASNGFEIALADGSAMWIYDDTSLKTVTMPFTTPPTRVVFHEGYFITFEPDSGQYYISNSFNGFTWDALDFATAEDQPDNIKELIADRLLWIGGETSLQAYDAYPASFPFVPNYSGRILYGIRGRTAAQLSNTTYWLGTTAKGSSVAIYRLRGFQPEPVSPAGYNEYFSRLPDIDKAYAMSLNLNGQEFYVITFPESNRTFAMSDKGIITEWGVWNKKEARHYKHPAKWFLNFDGKTIFSDDHGNLMYLDYSTTQHNGVENVRELVSEPIHKFNRRVAVKALTLDMHQGNAPLGNDSTIMLSVSYDGGTTFGNWIPTTVGRQGDFNAISEWRRLGSGYNIVFKVRVSDDFDWHVQGAAFL